MKYFYSVSLLFLILISCAKDENKVIDREKTDWAFYKINGNVKSLSEKSYETFDGKQKGTTKHEIASEHNRDLEFNDEGMLLAEKTWTNDGKKFEDVNYKGREIKLNHVQYIGGSPSLKTDYVWDESGKNNLSVTRRNADNTSFDKVVMKYKNDKIIEHITYNAQGTPTNRIGYIYDKEGNLIEENFYMDGDAIQYKAEYKYNDKGQKISEVHYNKERKIDYETRYDYSGDNIASLETTNGKGEVSYVEKNTYDNKGNLISGYTFDKFDGVHMRDEYKYDAEGNRIEWNVYKGDDLYRKASYGYDKHGNLTKVMASDAEGNVLESKVYKYEYDKQGNWIKKTFFAGDRPAIITERKITYFVDK